LVEEIPHITGPIALDTETFDPTGEDRALDVRRTRVRLLQLAVGESAPYVVDARTAGDIGPLLEALADRPVVVHNAAYDLAVLRTNYDYIHRGPVFDTFLAAKVFYAGTNNRAGLEDLLAGLLEVKVDKTNQTSDWSGELSEGQLVYAARDVLHLHELADVLRARTGKSSMADVVELENRMVKVTAEMTALGMPVDEAVFAECVRESVESVEKSVAALDALVTEPLPEKFAKANAKNKNTPIERVHRVNWNSTAQVLWAFQTAGLKLRSTDKQTRAKHEGHPMVDALSALRDGGDIARRFKETEVADGRVHATWKQVEAATGRMSCEKPPLQGISKPLRRAFVAPAGHDLVISDLSQIEVRVLCAISGDDNLRQEFIAGADVHTAVAANVLGVTRDEVTPEQRKLAKSLVFGLLYGQGLKGFADKAREVFKKNYTERDVERLFWKPFFEAYPGVARWRQNAIDRFKRGRHDSYTALGRRRLGLTSDRQALNAPIQGGAADVMKAIAVAVYQRRLEVPGLEIVGLVHDEILATVPEEHAAAAAALVHEVMKEVGEEVTNIGVDEGKRVPVEAKTQACDSWAEKE
jgi:DNA polymerase I